MSVDRCVCYDVLFTQIAALAKSGKSLEQIRVETGCSGGCGMCKPYIDVVIATGRTELPVMSEEVCRAIVERAGEKKEGGGR
jgi:bacterioferritin-associated ferredoxin